VKQVVIDNMMELKDVKKYICGSPNLCKFLEQNGLKPSYSYKLSKERNNRTMWVFIMTPELSKLLTQWTNNKPSNKVVK
jgi:hypothetical protein